MGPPTGRAGGSEEFIVVAILGPDWTSVHPRAIILPREVGQLVPHPSPNTGSRPMKRALCTATLFLALVSSCATKGINEHWKAESTIPRMERFFLGYNAERDGDYLDFAWHRRQANQKTLMRHFLNINPDNPNHTTRPRSKKRPVIFDPAALLFPGGMTQLLRPVVAIGQPVKVITSTIAHELIGPPLAGMVTGLASILPKRNSEGSEEPEDADASE